MGTFSRLFRCGPVTESAHPLVLLLGDPSARPDGLERALVRAGFQLVEAERIPSPSRGAHLPALILITWPDHGPGLKDLLTTIRQPHMAGVPSLVLLSEPDREGPAVAMEYGASDAMGAPVHLAEVCSRIRARLGGVVQMQGIRRATEYQALLLDIFQEASSALRPEEMINTIVRRAGDTLRIASCSFVQTPPGEPFGRVTAAHENPTVRDLQVDLTRYPEILEAVAGDKPVIIEDVHSHPLFESVRKEWEKQDLEVNFRGVAAFPVRMHSAVYGVLLLRTGLEDIRLGEHEIAFAQSLVTASSKLLEMEERRAGIHRRQVAAGATDPLTGCGSLDALDRRIREEFARARRYALTFSLILLDIDELRTVNELLGPAVGDRVLVEVGAILQHELRAPDFVSRYGGDEFALILPETDLEGARRSISRVRQRILSHPFPDVAIEQRPRVSAGIVAFPHPAAMQAEDLFALVEAALLRGKSQSEERIGTAESVAA